MKKFLNYAILLVFLCSLSAYAKSDADVTILKVKDVIIEEAVITIVVEKAEAMITLIKGEYDPDYTGDMWNGMPANRVKVISNEATFIIKQDAHSAPGGALAHAWKDCLKTAKDLKDGKEVGRIGFNRPDVVIKGNMIIAITGSGFLYPKGK